SIEGYVDPSDEASVQDFLLFTDAVDYCRRHGVPVFAAAGNEHVRVSRVTMTLDGRRLEGVGQVSTGSQGIALTAPGSDSLAEAGLRGGAVVAGGGAGVRVGVGR